MFADDQDNTRQDTYPMTFEAHTLTSWRMRDKVPQQRRWSSSQASGAQAASASKRQSLGFDMDVEGESLEVSVPKKSRTASATIAGTRVNVLA